MTYMRILKAGLTLTVLCLAAATAEVPKPVETPLDSWVGIYTSTTEIAGFSGTVLAIEKDFSGKLRYRMTFYSDVGRSQNEIKETEKQGEVLIDGDKLYLPQAYGHIFNGKPTLRADITRYTRLEIKGRRVFLRDDALKAFRKQNKLYDYGILIKVADGIDSELDRAKHESIKVLYQDAAKEWKDPFVNGPNER